MLFVTSEIFSYSKSWSCSSGGFPPPPEDLLFYILYINLRTIWNWSFVCGLRWMSTYMCFPPIQIFNLSNILFFFFFEKIILFQLKFNFEFKVEIHSREITVFSCIGFQTVVHRNHFGMWLKHRFLDHTFRDSELLQMSLMPGGLAHTLRIGVAFMRPWDNQTLHPCLIYPCIGTCTSCRFRGQGRPVNKLIWGNPISPTSSNLLFD